MTHRCASWQKKTVNYQTVITQRLKCGLHLLFFASLTLELNQCVCGGAASLPASSPHPLPHTHPVALEKVGASFSFANDLGSGYNGPLRCFVEEKRKMELSGEGIKRLEWGPGTPGRRGLESDPGFSEKRGQEGPYKGPESS